MLRLKFSPNETLTYVYFARVTTTQFAANPYPFTNYSIPCILLFSQTLKGKKKKKKKKKERKKTCNKL